MTTSAGLASGELPCGGQEVLCPSGSPPCACPTLLDDVSRPASLAEGSRIFFPFSSLDSFLDSRRTHHPRTPWDWDTSSWRWASPGTPPSLT
ncbi:MAG: hypothetical protein ACK56I_15130, partial [bacterium]